MLGANGAPLGWTYDARRYALVRASVLKALDALSGDDGVATLKDIVAFVQHELGEHASFPSGRLTNATRYVCADLQGRGVLIRIGSGSPQRLRRG